MIATLKFFLPEDAEDHRLACGAHEMATVLSELDADCRSWQHHGNCPHETVAEMIEWVMEQINEVQHIIKS